jgi:tetratricopeptide (TPR) repeat protein
MSEDRFTEVTRTRWGGRLKRSFKGIIFGLIPSLGAIPPLFWNEGRAVKRYQALKEGQGALLSVFSEDVDPAAGWIRTGKTAYVAGHYDEAAGAFARAIALKPLNGSALYHLGVMRNKTGETAGALDCFRQTAGVGHQRAQKLLRSQKIGW